MNIAKLTSPPRQDTAIITKQPETSAVGISAFAFQGTNAHAILSVQENIHAHLLHHRVLWDKQSIMSVSRAHPLINDGSLAKKSGEWLFETVFGSTTRLGYLWDYKVGSRTILPGSAFVELTGAAMGMLLSESANLEGLSLAGVAFRVPLEMSGTDKAPKRDQWPAMICAVDRREGTFELYPRANAGLKHVAGAASTCFTGLRASEDATSAASGAMAYMCSIVKPAQTTSSTYVILARVAHFGIAKGGGSGYKAHPATMDCAIHLAAAKPSQGEATSIPAGMRSIATFGHVCSKTERAAAWIAPGDAGLSNHSLQDGENSSGVSYVSGLETRLAPRQAAAVDTVKAVVDDGKVHALYVGVWQAAQGSMTPAVPAGRWLSINTSKHASYPSAAIPTGNFSGVEFLSPAVSALARIGFNDQC
jgi:hypothetical protein